jgi:hypothetical protein
MSCDAFDLDHPDTLHPQDAAQLLDVPARTLED